MRQVEMISANVVHDSRLGEALTQGDGSPGKSNTPAIRSRPPRHSPTPGRGRAEAVELAVAAMKRLYGDGPRPLSGLARNACHLQLIAMAINKKRALVIRRAA